MKKRLFIVVAILGAGAFLALGVFLLLRNRSGVTEANLFSQIRLGMAKAEVVAFFGEPDTIDTPNVLPYVDGLRLWWIGADGNVHIWFDANGRVVAMMWEDQFGDTFQNSILIWLGLKHVQPSRMLSWDD
jgi:hypothetical protein